MQLVLGAEHELVGVLAGDARRDELGATAEQAAGRVKSLQLARSVAGVHARRRGRRCSSGRSPGRRARRFWLMFSMSSISPPNERTLMSIGMFS